MGVDLGMTYIVKDPWLSVGFAVQDLNRTVITWDSGAKDRLPLRLRLGTSAKLSQTLLSGQFSWDDEVKKSQQFHLGIEQELFNRALVLRAGTNEKDNFWLFSLGMGIQLKTLGIDYAWERQTIMGDSQTVSLHFRF